MKWAALAGIFGGLASHIAGPPTPETLNALSLIEAAAALIAIVSGALAYRKFRTLGAAQREEISVEAAQRASAALDTALARHILLLDQALASIAKLEEQLQDAKERIAKLEEALDHSNGERDRLQATLEAALRERATLELRLAEAEKQVASLDARVGGRRQTDSTRDPPGQK